MTYAFGNAQSIGERQTQEDAFGFSDPSDSAFVAHGGFLAVLADGMGGMAHGDLAGRSAVRAFLDTYATKLVEEAIPDALARALVAANTAVLDAAARVGNAGQLGSTLVAAVLHGNEAYWISIGDSALFHVGTEGLTQSLTQSLTQWNRPHVYSIDLDARVIAGELSLEQALADPQREALTSYLGMPAPPLVDRNLRPMRIDAASALVLASDGLFKSAPPASFPFPVEDLQEHCERLVKLALESGIAGQDNVTVLALKPVQEVVDAVVAPLAIPFAISLAPPKRRWLRWAAAAVLVFSAAGALVWIAQREAAARALSAAPTNIRETNGQRFDTKKLPEIHEAQEP